MSTIGGVVSSSEEAWSEVAEHLRTLGSLVMDRADPAAETHEPTDTGPTDDEFKEAVRIIGERASSALGALTESIRDPEVRAEAEETTSAFLRAVGVSFSELGTQLSDLASGGGSDNDLDDGTWLHEDEPEA